MAILACALSGALSSCRFFGVPTTYTIDKPFNRLQADEDAMLGDPDGQYKIGTAFLYGKDAPINYEKGTAAMCHAARRGHVPAQMALGEFYEGLAKDYPLAPSSDGLSTPGFDAVAWAWYDIAARNGSYAAGWKRDRLAKHFTVAAHSTAKSMSQKFPETPCEFPPPGICDMAVQTYPRLCAAGSRS